MEHMNDHLQTMLRKRVEAAVHLREITRMRRTDEGQEALSITVCLGPGRCCVPGAEEDGRTCPFCKVFPTGIASHREVDVFLGTMIKGN